MLLVYESYHVFRDQFHCKSRRELQGMRKLMLREGGGAIRISSPSARTLSFRSTLCGGNSIFMPRYSIRAAIMSPIACPIFLRKDNTAQDIYGPDNNG